jgi:hypothetical protein
MIATRGVNMSFLIRLAGAHFDRPVQFT